MSIRWVVSVMIGLTVGGLFKWNNVENPLDVFGFHTVLPVWPSAILAGVFAAVMVFVFGWTMFSRPQTRVKA